MNLWPEPEPDEPLVARPVGRASEPERQEAARAIRAAMKTGGDPLFYAVFFSGYVLSPDEVRAVATVMLQALERTDLMFPQGAKPWPTDSTVVPGSSTATI